MSYSWKDIDGDRGHVYSGGYDSETMATLTIEPAQGGGGYGVYLSRRQVKRLRKELKKFLKEEAE